jgi:hypothetical protein
MVIIIAAAAVPAWPMARFTTADCPVSLWQREQATAKPQGQACHSQKLDSAHALHLNFLELHAGHPLVGIRGGHLHLKRPNSQLNALPESRGDHSVVAPADSDNAPEDAVHHWYSAHEDQKGQHAGRFGLVPREGGVNVPGKEDER